MSSRGVVAPFALACAESPGTEANAHNDDSNNGFVSTGRTPYRYTMDLRILGSSTYVKRKVPVGRLFPSLVSSANIEGTWVVASRLRNPRLPSQRSPAVVQCDLLDFLGHRLSWRPERRCTLWPGQMC